MQVLPLVRSSCDRCYSCVSPLKRGVGACRRERTRMPCGARRELLVPVRVAAASARRGAVAEVVVLVAGRRGGRVVLLAVVVAVVGAAATTAAAPTVAAAVAVA